MVFEEWRHAPVFLGSDEEFANASRRTLTDIMKQYPTELRLEMSVLMELERFVKATYTLEGNGDLFFVAYQKLEQLKAFIQVENYATMTAEVQELFPLSPALQYQWYNSPRYIKISRPTASDVDWLRVVPFLSSNGVI